MLNFKLSLSLFLFLTVTISASFAQITNAEVDALMEEALQKFQVAGAAIAIVKDGKVFHQQGYGLKSVDTKEKVKANTAFAIASNSKAFTTAALAILVEEGKISWQDKVKTHIPEFTMYNDYVAENFTIQDLLTHRSGLGLGAGDLMVVPDGSSFTIQDILRAFQYLKPQSAFRTKFDYDNLLYFVAGEVIARVSGMSWSDFIQARILTPLGMKNAYPKIAYVKDRKQLATPHSIVDGKLKTIGHFDFGADKINGAAGAIYASVDDLTHWILAQLNQGKYGDQLEKQLFSVQSQHEMWQIHTPLPVNRNPRYNTHFAGYGLGWRLEDVKGNLMASHTGGLPGMLSKTVLIPDLNFGVVVLTNSDNGGSFFTAITRTIVDRYLGLDDFGWTDKLRDNMLKRQAQGDEVTEKVWKTVAAAKQKVINEANFIGDYQDPWFGKVTVFKKNGKLWFKSHRSPKLNGEMMFYQANTFAIQWAFRDLNADAFAMFMLDEEGKAQGIKMKGISPNIDFSFDFQDLAFERVEEEK